MTARAPEQGLAGADACFTEHIARGAAPAAAWGVFDASGLRHERNAFAEPGAAWRIASCTKSFTAAALLSLRDEGLLGLDDPVTRFVPELNLERLPSAGSAVPSLRMLVTMSSGLPTDDAWADRQESLSAAAFSDLLASGVRFESEPGTRYAYSNLGYAVLGRVIERATGSPYRRVVEQRLLEPLGLSSTGFDAAVPAPGGVMTGHRRRAGGWEPLPLSGPGAFSPIGGLFSTVADLASWAAWLASAFRSPDRDDAILSAASRREMQQIHRINQDAAVGPAGHASGYGYGLVVEQRAPGNRVVSHSGGYPGFSAHMRWSPERGVGVVAFENATYSRVLDAATAALDVMLAARPPAPAGAPSVWPETRAAQRTVNALVAAWASGAEAVPLPGEYFSENVERDDALSRRVAACRAAVAEIGGLRCTTPVDGRESSEGPAHLAWALQGAGGRLRIEIQLTPEATPRVQWLSISADRVGR